MDFISIFTLGVITGGLAVSVCWFVSNRIEHRWKNDV